MSYLAPGERRALIVSYVLWLLATALVAIAFFVPRAWSPFATGAGCMLIAAEALYARRLAKVGWGPAARQRVSAPRWHRWVTAVVAIAAGVWMLILGSLR